MWMRHLGIFLSALLLPAAAMADQGAGDPPRRNLASFAKEGKFLEVGSGANMGSVVNGRRSSGSAGGSNPSESSVNDDGPSNNADEIALGGRPHGGSGNRWDPPPRSSFDPAMDMYAEGDANGALGVHHGCGAETSCNSCLDVGTTELTLPGHTMCVWCASSGTYPAPGRVRSRSPDVRRKKQPRGVCAAGIATMPHHCGSVVNQITKHFVRKADPVQVGAEEELAKKMPFTVNINSPRQGEWVGHLEPADIALDGFFRAEEGKPTLVDICFSLFGPSSSGSLGIVEIFGMTSWATCVSEPGPYTMNAWALDNVDDKLLFRWLLLISSAPRSVRRRHLRQAHSGFPRTTEDSGLTKVILNTNRKVFGLGRDASGLQTFRF